MNQEHEKEIKKLLSTYFDANKALDAEKVISLWHEDSKIFSIEKIYTREDWIPLFDGYKKEINGDLSKFNVEFTIKSIDIVGNCADVRLDVDYSLGDKTFGETQFIHLLRNDSNWVIYNKIFTYYGLPRDF